MNRLVRSYLIPAAVFQAVVFGGAYGTGREIVEYITRYGGIGGIWAMLLVALIWGSVLALSFECARIMRTYDYRRFIRALIGRGWIAYELLFAMTLLLVLAVNASAAGLVLEKTFAIPYAAGVIVLVCFAAALSYMGRAFVEKSMLFCVSSLVLVLAIYLVVLLQSKGIGPISGSVDSPPIVAALGSGFQYALYNLGIVPVLIYCAEGIDRRSDAFASGLFTGSIGVVPALVFHVTFVGDIPEIFDVELPTYWMIEGLGREWLLALYVIVLFAMIIQTAVGVLQGLNERLDSWFRERKGRPLSARAHAGVAVVFMLAGIALAQIGIIALIARGYGMLAWGYLLIFVVPLFSLGLYRVASGRACDTELPDQAQTTQA